ncbi:SgcJ/EcaC family oxidoreductase [Enterobacter asburiae]|nr:SgcJ/EcaC family oxidoreductase [Enterobacter asburiae]
MNYLSFLPCAVLVLSTSAFASATTSARCVSIDNQAIEVLFERWNDALRSGNAEKVADNYLSDAVLLPALSNKPARTDAERIDYFTHFLEKKPVGRIDTRTIRLGCNEAIDTGTYTFTLADMTTVAARYTFTWFWTGTEWKISSHHSSAMPEG